MKRVLCLALAICLCCTCVGFSAYAEDAYPDIDAMTDEAFRTLLSKNEADSWNEIGGYIHNGTVDVADGVVNYTPNDNDNGFFFHPSPSVIAAETKKIKMRIKVPVKINELKIYFENELGLSEDRTFILTDVQPSDEFQIIDIDTSKNAAWTGTIHNYRISITGAVGQTFAVDYVYFYSDYNPAYTEDERCVRYDFNTKSYGFAGNAGVTDLVPYNSELWMRICGADAALTTTDAAFSVEAALIPQIQISYQTPGTEGKLYFTTDAMPEYNPDCVFLFETQPGDGTYAIDTVENENWTGTITGLRFVPSNVDGIVRLGAIQLDKFPCTIAVRGGIISGSGNLYGKMGRLTIQMQDVETGETVYRGSIRTNLKGEFTFSIELTEVPTTPVYYDLLFEGSELGGVYKKRILYISTAYIDAVQNEINAARMENHAALVRSLIEENYQLIGLQAPLYALVLEKERHMEEVYTKLLGTVSADLEELNCQLDEAAMLVQIKYMPASEWRKAIDEYDAYLKFKQLSAYQTYASASDNTKEEIEETLSAAQCEGIAAAQEAFQKHTILISLRNAVAWGDVKTILQVNAELLEIDITKAEKLKSPSEAYRQLTERTFETFAAVKQAFDDAVAAQVKKESVKNPGGSAGGGGKGSGSSGKSSNNAVYVPQPVIDKDKQPDDTPNVKPAFADLAGFDWAKAAIAQLSEKGIVTGNGNGKFEPAREMKREEFIKILVLALNLPLSQEAEFVDVPADAWYAKYVGAALKAGLVRGQGDAFGVGQPLSRQDAAVIAARVLAMEAPGEPLAFADADTIAAYAKSAVDTLAQAGIVKGFDDGTFRPLGTLNRAEATVMLSRMVGRIEK